MLLPVDHPNLVRVEPNGVPKRQGDAVLIPAIFHLADGRAVKFPFFASYEAVECLAQPCVIEASPKIHDVLVAMVPALEVGDVAR
jgi:hypothetical protein